MFQIFLTRKWLAYYSSCCQLTEASKKEVSLDFVEIVQRIHFGVNLESQQGEFQLKLRDL